MYFAIICGFVISCLWTRSPSPSSLSGATDLSLPPSSSLASTMWSVASTFKSIFSFPSGGCHPWRVPWPCHLHWRCCLGRRTHCKVSAFNCISIFRSCSISCSPYLSVCVCVFPERIFHRDFQNFPRTFFLNTSLKGVSVLASTFIAWFIACLWCQFWCQCSFH